MVTTQRDDSGMNLAPLPETLDLDEPAVLSAVAVRDRRDFAVQKLLVSILHLRDREHVVVRGNGTLK